MFLIIKLTWKYKSTSYSIPHLPKKIKWVYKIFMNCSICLQFALEMATIICYNIICMDFFIMDENISSKGKEHNDRYCIEK